jgi:hypothetical protein
MLGLGRVIQKKEEKAQLFWFGSRRSCNAAAALVLAATAMLELGRVIQKSADVFVFGFNRTIVRV